MFQAIDTRPVIHPTTKKHLGKAPRYPQCTAASTRAMRGAEEAPAVSTSTSQPITSSNTTAMVRWGFSV